MGKKQSQPDYVGAAQAQGAANKDAAIAEWQMNNPNQTSPWGTKTTTQTGTRADGSPIYSVDTTLNPQDQANLDAERQINSDLMKLAPTAMNNVWGQIGKPIDTSKLPAMVDQVDTQGMEKIDLSKLPGAQYGAEQGQIQKNLDFSGLTPLDDAGAVRNQVTNAMFNQFYGRYAPEAQRQQSQLQTQIANMGGVTSSDAARRKMGGLLTNQGDQFRQGIFDSIIKGGDAAQQQFGMNLAGRQQGVSEVGKQGDFWNAAQGQDFSQKLANAGMWNAARGQDADLIQQQQQANNSSTQQDIQNAFANANLANQGRAQGLTELTNLRQTPLNELMAMLSQNQVGQLQFQPVTGTQIQPAPIYNATKDQATNNTASANNTMTTIGSIAGAGMMAF